MKLFRSLGLVFLVAIAGTVIGSFAFAAVSSRSTTGPAVYTIEVEVVGACLSPLPGSEFLAIQAEVGGPEPLNIVLQNTCDVEVPFDWTADVQGAPLNVYLANGVYHYTAVALGTNEFTFYFKSEAAAVVGDKYTVLLRASPTP